MTFKIRSALLEHRVDTFKVVRGVLSYTLKARGKLKRSFGREC